jgi:hypothetical protein
LVAATTTLTINEDDSDSAAGKNKWKSNYLMLSTRVLEATFSCRAVGEILLLVAGAGAIAS